MRMEDKSKNEILGAINDFANHTEKRFDFLESEIGTVKTDVSTLKTDVSTLKTDVSTLRSEVGIIKSEMVTKDYLDDKLADLRGDMVVLTRKEDTKFNSLVSLLNQKEIISDEEKSKIESMEPFPKLAL